MRNPEFGSFFLQFLEWGDRSRVRVFVEGEESESLWGMEEKRTDEERGKGLQDDGRTQTPVLGATGGGVHLNDPMKRVELMLEKKYDPRGPHANGTYGKLS
ncbi:hypothetical protein NPIL_434431 [Nephila pilipes]|uniref:Uncharacterized protein n=1 Tax=Nephila pilipes TaxID=299642 RepID=A0A8X6ME45_NEPPI|nr:hypothetical protein NPIL_392001 [Nephila pilipes]GFU12929.1 hypothetical protein NPIL_434431 [Nephila pilipes]